MTSLLRVLLEVLKLSKLLILAKNTDTSLGAGFDTRFSIGSEKPSQTFSGRVKRIVDFAFFSKNFQKFGSVVTQLTATFSNWKRVKARPSTIRSRRNQHAKSRKSTQSDGCGIEKCCSGVVPGVRWRRLNGLGAVEDIHWYLVSIIMKHGENL